MHEILGSVGLIWICQQNLYLMYARNCIPVDLSAKTLKSLDDETVEWIACVKRVICAFYFNKCSVIFFELQFCDWSVADKTLFVHISVIRRWYVILSQRNYSGRCALVASNILHHISYFIYSQQASQPPIHYWVYPFAAFICFRTYTTLKFIPCLRE